MKPKSLILLVLALGCGLAASIGISRVMDANANRPAASLDTTPIYVALHNINLGDPIDASMVSLEEWPTDRVPKGSLTTLEDLEGRRPRTQIVTGTPLLEAHLLAMGETADPVANIPDGFRLQTISVNAEKSAAGLLSPGDRVDVQLFMAANARAGVPTASARVILQNIRVFAVEQAVQRAAEGDEGKAIPKTVSLLVTPEQAQKLNLAQNLGELSLSPRNPTDETDAQTAGITVEDLLGTRADKNDRVTEQNRSKAQPNKSGLFDTVVGMMTRAAKEQPPFEMTIVQAEEVSTMQFDSRTGAPVAGAYDAYRGGGATRNVSQFTPDKPVDFAPQGDDFSDSADFPIDFEGQ